MGAFFIATDVPGDELTITEGKLVVASVADLETLREKLTPLTQFGLRALKMLGESSNKYATFRSLPF